MNGVGDLLQNTISELPFWSRELLLGGSFGCLVSFAIFGGSDPFYLSENTGNVFRFLKTALFGQLIEWEIGMDKGVRQLVDPELKDELINGTLKLRFESLFQHPARVAGDACQLVHMD